MKILCPFCSIYIQKTIVYKMICEEAAKVLKIKNLTAVSIDAVFYESFSI